MSGASRGRGDGRGSRGGQSNAGSGRGGCFHKVIVNNIDNYYLTNQRGSGRGNSSGGGNRGGRGPSNVWGENFFGGSSGGNRGGGSRGGGGEGSFGKGGKTKENEKSGSGLASTLLLAGGAAAVGFLANELWNGWKDYQKEEEATSSRSRASTSGWSASHPEPKEDWNKTETKAKSSADYSETDSREGVTCIVCMANPRQVILLPCHHVCVCKECVEKIEKSSRKCPVCMQYITDKKTAYLP